MANLGIELLDLRLKRLNYVEQVQKDVFARMIAERNRVAELFRSEGEGEAARIRGERERELKRIQSEAYRSAEELRGKADAQATDIYADAHGSDPEFYAFTKSLETYEHTMDTKTIFILGTDSELLRFLGNRADLSDAGSAPHVAPPAEALSRGGRHESASRCVDLHRRPARRRRRRLWSCERT